MVSEFKPIDMIKVIRDDQALTSGQFKFLVCAVVRTDNATGRVRASQRMLAEDMGVEVRTVERYLTDKQVRGYFRTQKVGREVWLRWGADTRRDGRVSELENPTVVSGVEESDTRQDGRECPTAEAENPTGLSRIPDTGVGPSALSAFPSASSSAVRVEVSHSVPDLNPHRARGSDAPDFGSAEEQQPDLNEETDPKVGIGGEAGSSFAPKTRNDEKGEVGMVGRLRSRFGRGRAGPGLDPELLAAFGAARERGDR